MLSDPSRGASRIARAVVLCRPGRDAGAGHERTLEADQICLDRTVTEHIRLYETDVENSVRVCLRVSVSLTARSSLSGRSALCLCLAVAAGSAAALRAPGSVCQTLWPSTVALAIRPNACTHTRTAGQTTRRSRDDDTFRLNVTRRRGAGVHGRSLYSPFLALRVSLSASLSPASPSEPAPPTAAAAPGSRCAS